MATENTLTCYLPRPEEHSSCNFHSSFFWLTFLLIWVIRVIWQFSFNTSLQSTQNSLAIHIYIYMYIVLPSPLFPPMTLSSSSLNPRRPSPQYLPTFPQSFPSNRNEKVVEVYIISRDHRTLVAKPMGTDRRLCRHNYKHNRLSILVRINAGIIGTFSHLNGNNRLVWKVSFSTVVQYTV